MYFTQKRRRSGLLASRLELGPSACVNFFGCEIHLHLVAH
jgi:hypothetical protein